MKKKIAVIIRGLSYVERYYRFSKYLKIDYRKSLNNLIEKIFFPLYINNDLDFFISTNPSKMQDHIKNQYKPKFCELNDYENEKNIYKKVASRIIKCIDEIKKYEINNKIQYDAILILRFDILFKKEFKNLRIDYNKFNISFMAEKGILIDDNVFFIPRKYLDAYRKSINEHCILGGRWTHGLLPIITNNIGGFQNINFMIDGRYNVKNNALYTIIRDWVN